MAKILVVDDEQPIVQLMQFILEKIGHEVSVAYNGAEMLEALGVEPKNESAPLPDLILLDLMMPIMDGLTACLRLRDDARASKIPVVIVTAKGDMRSAFEKVPSVAAFFHKPFDPGALRVAVDKALASKKQ